MKFDKKELSLRNGISKEWIITNGIGGYSSSTILGANTRKYHGLLVAALNPPGKRFVVLSKLDESIEIEGEKHDLYTNICKNYISEGHKYIENFEKDIIPIFTYKVKDIEIKKLICMEYNKNSVCILYKIKNGKNNIKLNLAPVLNFRDFHVMKTNHEFQIVQEINEKKIKIAIDGNTDTPIYLYASEGNYIEHFNDTFRNMYYIEEERRGFYPEENHIVSGKYEMEIAARQQKEISFICSLEENIEEINVKNVIDNEVKRVNEIIYDTKLIAENKKGISKETQFIKDLIMATDSFIVNRPSFGLHTMIAGYPWFLDWGRDTAISYEGCFLLTKRYDLAKELLLLMVRDIKFGLVPNGYSGFDSRPLYNSADSSLLLFEQVYKYIYYTGDIKFIKNNIYESLVKIIDYYKKGTDLDDNNIYLDKDGLVSSGTAYTQNTWMDAKYGEFIATPRNGKAVEINSLWYNALMIMEELSKKTGNKKSSKKYLTMAQKCQESFIEKFYNQKRKCLYDVIGDKKIRPNQLFSISLSHPVIDPGSTMAKEIFDTVTKKLLTKYGLKTLAKGEEGYVDTYEGNSFRRDMSYHQGTVWTWLLGLYYDSLKNIIKEEKDKEQKRILENKLKKFIEETKKTFQKSLYEDDCVGNLSEIYDARTPHLPRGNYAQAWSVAEVLRIILEK